MREKHSGENESKEIFYADLERYARTKIRGHLQDLLEQEVTEWLGRAKGERKSNPSEQPGYRNGYGKRRRFTMSLGTIEIRRPRVRNLDERFVSKILPMFKRQSQEVRGLIPELYLHGLASGDFELVLAFTINWQLFSDYFDPCERAKIPGRAMPSRYFCLDQLGGSKSDVVGGDLLTGFVGGSD